MKAVRNDETGTWHLLGARGCGQKPDGERLDATSSNRAVENPDASTAVHD